MSQLPISINKKIYNIQCPDTERKAVLGLADYVNEKIALVAPSCKAMSEVALLSMTLLAVADDVTQCRAEIKELKENANIHNNPPQEKIITESAIMGATILEDKDLHSALEVIKNLTQTLRDEMSNT